jgi:perosamine synthetase
MPAPARHELPAYSPLSAMDLVVALGRRVLFGSDEVERTRALVAADFDADDVVLVDSGRSALQLAIALSLPRAGTRVVALPAFQCYEVASAAVGADCGIVLYDVDPASLQPELASLERALRRGATVVVVAPLYGFPVDWDAITRLTRTFGAVAIEDAAQGHGAAWNGHRLGSLGDVSVVSFGRGKGWTGGRCGALMIRHAAPRARPEAPGLLAGQRARGEMGLVATTVLQLVFGRAALYAIPASIPSLGLGETRYHQPTPPTPATSFSTALIRQTRTASDRESVVRRRNAEQWDRSLPAHLLVGTPKVLDGGTPGYLRYPLRVSEQSARAAGSGAARRAGVARSYPRPLATLTAVGPRLLEPTTHFPGAEALARELVTLPTHSRLTQSNRDTIVALAAGWAGPSTSPARTP